MFWRGWRARRRAECWHDLIGPEDTRAGEVAEEAREELRRLAEVMDEPTVMFRDLRVPPWLVFTSGEDEW